MAQLNLENGSAGKRLGAKLVDGIPPALISGLAAVVGMPLIGYEQVSASSAVVDLSMFFVVMGAGSLLALGYWIFLWGWDAKTGKTPGNLMFGLRTTDEEGFAPGWLAVFLRNLIIALSGIIPVLGFVIVMISNLFDPHGKRQGWYDKAARTFVFDVRRGRNPLLTGGRDLVLESVALIGRNPAGKDNEPAQLIPVKDEGRSVSKTHLHLRVDAGRLWVTDRHSTNGSAVGGADGERTPLPGGQPSWAPPGSTVYFGDRSFRVEQA